MSTYWYFECQSHDPKIRMEDGINHGQKGLEELLIIFKNIPLTDDWPIEIVVKVEGQSYPYSFLKDHLNCHVMIVSEYGDYWINGQEYRTKKES